MRNRRCRLFRAALLAGWRLGTVADCEAGHPAAQLFHMPGAQPTRPEPANDGAARMMARLVLALALVTLPAADGPVGADRIVANPNRAPAGRLRSGVLTLTLELRTGMLRPARGRRARRRGPGVRRSRASRCRFPGPLIRVPEGTVIHATIRNRAARLDARGPRARTRIRPRPGDRHPACPPGAERSVRFVAGRAGNLLLLGDDDRQEDGRRPVDRQPALRRVHRRLRRRAAAAGRAGLHHGPLVQGAATARRTTPAASSW